SAHVSARPGRPRTGSDRPARSSQSAARMAGLRRDMSRFAGTRPTRPAIAWHGGGRRQGGGEKRWFEEKGEQWRSARSVVGWIVHLGARTVTSGATYFVRSTSRSPARPF